MAAISQVPGKTESRNEFAARFDEWLQAHSPWAVLGVLFAAFAVRFYAAWGTFLNPDEALHVRLANHLTWADAYHASLTSAHPPGLILLLYFWRDLGTSEILLRVPSIIAGTAFCWVMFKWIERLFGTTAAWVGLLLSAFLPPMIELSSQVRQYALLLLFIACALYFLEIALDRNSTAWMLLSAGSLYLALLMHYSGFLFAAAFYIYGFTRFLSGGIARFFLATWFISGCGVLALFAYFYRTHLSRLPKTAMAAEAMQGWMRNSYYHPGHDHILSFSFARTGGVFQFIFGQLALGDIAFVGFVIAVVMLIRNRSRVKSASWQLAILFTAPFVINDAAAIAGLYPYGGTRHSVFIAPMILAAFGFLMATTLRQKTAPAVICALVIISIASLFGHPHKPYMTRSGQNRQHMVDAVSFVERQVPPSEVVFTDYESGLLLSHYLCHQNATVFDHSVQGFEQFHCGKHVIAAFPGPMLFSAESFSRKWGLLADRFNLKPGETVWLVQAGGDTISAAFLLGNSGVKLDADYNFGQNIAVSRLTVTSHRTAE